MRLTRWILLVLALSALATFAVRRRKGEEAERVVPASKVSLSPEETRQLIEQALARTNDTVRFRFDPSSAESRALPPIRPPRLSVTDPTPVHGSTPSGPPEDPDSPEVRVHLDSATQALSSALSKSRKLANPRSQLDPAAPSSAQPAPSAP